MQRTLQEHGPHLDAPYWCLSRLQGNDMIENRVLEDLGKRLSDAARNSPVQDLEKNLRALLGAFFDRFDVVLREDFDVQRKLLERAQAKLATLEARVAELEAKR
jgi:ubiquinone biosynthesis accessory factor UbiK